MGGKKVRLNEAIELYKWIIQLNSIWIIHAISYPIQAMLNLHKGC